LSRILALDYGTKRTGVAVTDMLQISINPLPTLSTPDLWDFLKEYFKNEEVATLVIGYPTHADGNPTYVAVKIDKFLKKIKKAYPSLEIAKVDEAYTSIEARNNLILMGVKKKKREQKSEIDKASAVLILKSYLNKKYAL